VLIFSTADFPMTDDLDSPPNNLAAVQITTLPTVGTLTLNGLPVTAGTLVSVVDLAGGLFRYRPPANAHGTALATFTFQVQDDGDIGGGGANLDPTPNVFTINVTSVNDAPQGANGAATILEDNAKIFALADFSFSDPNDTPANNFAGVVVVAPPAAGGTLTLSGTPVTAGQFVSATNIAAGLLRFTPALNANGSPLSSFTFQVRDDGGTASGGVDTDPVVRTFTINVTAVNDPPVFTAGPNVTATDADGARTITNWATGIGPGGGPDEAGQTVNFEVVNNTNPSLFSVQPAVAPNGTLTFTPAPNVAGTAQVTIRLKDNGGTANGGSDTSPTQTFTITVSKPNPWHNTRPGHALDVTGDRFLAPIDALTIINFLNAGLPGTGTNGSVLPSAPIGPPFYDVTNDMFVAPIDALTVINALNAGLGGPLPEGEGEGEGGGAPVDSVFAELASFGTMSGSAPAATSAPAASHDELSALIAALAGDAAEEQMRRRMRK